MVAVVCVAKVRSYVLGLVVLMNTGPSVMIVWLVLLNKGKEGKRKEDGRGSLVEG